MFVITVFLKKPVILIRGIYLKTLILSLLNVNSHAAEVSVFNFHLNKK